VALLAAGIWVAIDTSGATSTLASFLGSSSYATAAYVLIVCGVVILILGFLGCCGAIRESRCLLGTVSIDKSQVFKRSPYYHEYNLP
jgi:hypothetical protein